jgi:membrane-bound hydrogenase subunit beta
MFHEEEAIKAALLKDFEFLKENIEIKRARRIFAEIPLERFREVFDYAVGPLKFEMLYTITGLDDGEALGAIYHLGREGRIALNLHVRIPRQAPMLATVSDRFPAADIYERELLDLLGIQIEGLGSGHRYPLPDGWPAGEYPLRKEWKGNLPVDAEVKDEG